MTDNNIPKDPAVLAAYLLARGSEHLTELEREQVKATMAGYSGESLVAAVFDSDQNPEVFLRQRCHLAHAALIVASGISPTVALRRGYRSVDSPKELERLGFAPSQRRPGLVFPMRDVSGKIRLYQLRPDQPRLNAKDKPIKYEIPRGQRLILDVPSGARARLTDPTMPLFVTEGTRKADSAVSAGLCCVSVNGTWAWRGTDANGRTDPLACWKSVALKGRTIYVVFDSGVTTKPEVKAALAAFCEFLKGKGAAPRICHLEAAPDGTKVGLDDFLAAGHTAAELIATSGGEKPVIVVGRQGLAETAGQAWDALLAANSPPVLYRNGQELVRVVTDHKTKAPALIVMTEPRMTHRMARIAEWLTEKGKAAYPPARVIADMLVDNEAPVPPLNRIITVPGFTLDGRLLDTPGYDRASGILYMPPAEFSSPPVPDTPDDGDVARARGLILDEMLVDFPFTSDADRAAAVATLLGAFARGLVPGSTPLMMFEKPSPRTGAGLLIDSISRVVLGRDAAKTPEIRSEEEWAKRITAILLQAPTFVVLDNLRRRLDAPALATVLTTGVWANRILGGNQFVTLYTETLWVATANNPKLSTEMVGRTVSCRMDAKVERPGERTGFRHPQQLAWISANRADLVWSCLTLIRKWLADGAPAGHEVMGGFEAWARVLGGILASAGIPGLLANRGTFYQRADDEGDTIRPLLIAWWRRHGGEKVTARELLPLALETIDLEGKSEHAQRTRLGLVLKAERDRRYRLAPDVEITVAGAPDSHDKGFRWSLARVEPTPVKPGRFDHLDEVTVNLRDTEQVAKLVRGRGGLRPCPELRDVPATFLNKNGIALDHLSQEIAVAQGHPWHDVQDQLIAGLDRRYQIHQPKRRPVDPDDPRNDLEPDPHDDPEALSF